MPRSLRSADGSRLRGPVRRAKTAEGELGFPVSDERPIPDGLESEFEMGTITYVAGATQVIPR
ncbi:hypothetical protein [Rhodococcus sp. 14C212]|uniref:LGFP repeat-containing protein n=1 Tax=Rhodococcus sp. 14C212 TaxID=2711209 RepID=UPI001F115816|nr:hypothetical protein [Rhodococcus sp. 14C212]